MARFSSPQEVTDYAKNSARVDLENHLDFGVDLNPFCTEGARTQWQRGFDNKGPRPFESTLEFDTIYKRGREAANLQNIHAGAAA